MGQTVNLLSFDFGGSNPSAPTSFILILLFDILKDNIKYDDILNVGYLPKGITNMTP